MDAFIHTLPSVNVLQEVSEIGTKVRIWAEARKRDNVTSGPFLEIGRPGPNTTKIQAPWVYSADNGRF